MRNKLGCLVITLFLILGCDHRTCRANQVKQDDERKTGMFSLLTAASPDAGRYFLGDEYPNVEEDLRALLEELKRLEKDLNERMRREVLPLIKEEIERLRKWLREFQLEEDDPGPIGI